MDIQNLEIDPDFHLPIIPPSELNNLTVENNVENLHNPVPCVFGKFKITVYDGFKITENTRELCAMQHGPSTKYLPLRLSSAQSNNLPESFAHLRNNLVAICGAENHKVVLVSRDNLTCLISFFSFYPEFGPIYDQYVTEKDSTVTFNNNPPSSTAVGAGSVCAEDIRVTIHLLILMMGKNFNSSSHEVRQHVQAYVDRRMRAARYAVRNQNAKLLIDVSKLEDMQDIWNSVPKLKTAVFYFLFGMREQPEISVALTLLHDASMATIKCIIHFIEGKFPTEAHADLTVCEEAVRFNTEVEKMKSNMGNFWVHYRLLYPDDMTLSAQRFPILSKIGVRYCKKYINTEASFQRLIETNLPVDAVLLEKVNQRMNSRYMTPEAQVDVNNISQPIKNMARKWRFDLEKWSTAPHIRNLGDEPPHQQVTPEAIMEALNRLGRVQNPGNPNQNP